MRRLSQQHAALDVIMARGDPMLSHTGLSSFGRALRGRMGIRDGEPLALQQERVLRYIEQRPSCPEHTEFFLESSWACPSTTRTASRCVRRAKRLSS